MPLIDYIPAQTNIGFMRLRHYTFPLSAAVVVLAMVCFFTFGFNLGIDFGAERSSRRRPASSRLISVPCASTSPISMWVTFQIQEFGSPRDVLIRVGAFGTNEQEQQAIMSKITQALGTDYSVRRVETVGPSVSGELVRQSVVALILGAVAVLVYLWFRFEWQFAVGALATTAHDIFVTLMVYSIFGIDFDLTSIAAILTIMGYSLNDTVVVYDRIREMLRRYKKMPMPEMLDLSVNATFSRTIIVSSTTFFACLALYFFGGEVLKGFSLAMTVGVVIGTYSTIFVAAPILIHLGLRAQAVGEKPQPKADATLLDGTEAAEVIEEAEIIEEEPATGAPKGAATAAGEGKPAPAPRRPGRGRTRPSRG